MNSKIFVLILFLFFQSVVNAQKPTLKGFYKFDFGISRSSAQEMIKGCSKISGPDLYPDSSAPKYLWWITSEFANHSLSSMFSHSIPLIFYNDQFCSAVVHFDADYDTFKQIKEEITKKYFPGDIQETYYCKWVFLNDDYIELKYAQLGKNSLGYMMSEAIMTYVNKVRTETGTANEKVKKMKENIKYY